MQTPTPTDRTALSDELLRATLASVFADLPRVNLDAFRRALRAARDVNPLDVALIEIALVAECAAESVTVQ
jgi:hypothetical protein